MDDEDGQFDDGVDEDLGVETVVHLVHDEADVLVEDAEVLDDFGLFELKHAGG